MMKFGLLLVASYVCYTSALPPCVCGRNYLPVCGSDGTTYSNECRLNCEKSKGNTELHVAKEGHCDSQAAEKLCICTMEYKPVCGTSGQTYPNECALDCDKAKMPNLAKESDGPCPGDAEPTKVPDVCTCTRNMKPVCGSNGVSYSNECLLKCAASEQKKDITVARQGRCESDQPAAERLCMCTMDYRPVCGTDGVTYGNQCALDCERAKNALLEKKTDGECPKDDLPNVPEICKSCTRNMKRVCGSDGVSYNNECLLKCAAAEQKKEITVAREGRCEFDEDECECTRELIPVCGNDGVTYSNKCLMKCAGAEEASQGQC